MTDLSFIPCFSRRQFVKSAAALAFAQSAPRFLTGQAGKEKILAYVGTYTGAVGAGANGEGIYLFQMNAQTGELSQRKLVAKTPSPSWIAIHPNGKYLYAVNEISNFTTTPPSGSVSAFSINRANGDLTLLNVVSSQGAGPAHLSVDPLGEFAARNKALGAYAATAAAGFALGLVIGAAIVPSPSRPTRPHYGRAPAAPQC